MRNLRQQTFSPVTSERRVSRTVWCVDPERRSPKRWPSILRLALCLVLALTLCGILPTSVSKNQTAYAADRYFSVANETTLNTALGTGNAGDTVYITVTASFTIDAQKSVAGNRTIIMNSDDPANHQITRISGPNNTNPYGFYINAGGNFIIHDLVINGSADAGSIINVQGGTFTLGSGGVLQGQGNSTYPVEGAAIRAEWSNATNGPTVNILPGSKIQNNVSAGVGSAIAVGRHSADANARATLNMSGGEILNNETLNLNVRGNHGGGIWIGFNTDAQITGGEISDNLARGMGGAVYIAGTNSTLAMSNVTMDGNTSLSLLDPPLNTGTAGFGGAVALAGVSAPVAFTNCTITNNTANKSGITSGVGGGGGIAVNCPQDIVVTDCVITSNSAVTAPGGGISTGSSGGGDVYVEGTTEISGNSADTCGGGIAYDNTTGVFLSDDVKINDNTAVISGGGISFARVSDATTHIEPLTLSDNVQVHGNEAGTAGGGIYTLSEITLSDAVEISNNKAATHGGGIYGKSTINMSGNVKFNGNEAAGNGGGIYAMSTLAVQGTADFNGNKAPNGNGGGIYPAASPSDAAITLANLTVGSAATFKNNVAQKSYTRNPADNALYTAKIGATAWTSPLTQGYNNFDIAYINILEVPHNITVNNDGHGSGASSVVSTVSGNIVTLSATPAVGYVFDHWEIISGNVVLGSVYAQNTSFTMPAADVVFKAYFSTAQPTPQAIYNIYVSSDGNGTAAASHQGGSVSTSSAGGNSKIVYSSDDVNALASAPPLPTPANTTITHTAQANTGYVFDYWEVSPSGIVMNPDPVTDPMKHRCQCVMPAQDVYMVAHFKADTSGTGGNGGTGGTDDTDDTDDTGGSDDSDQTGSGTGSPSTGDTGFPLSMLWTLIIVSSSMLIGLAANMARRWTQFAGRSNLR